MEAFMESVHKVFEHGVELLVLLIELIGIAVLCSTVVKAIISIIRGEEDARLELAEGIALALDFKMCGEVLRTVIVRDLNELLILGIVIFLRACLALLIHWEIKTERQHYLAKQGLKELERAEKTQESKADKDDKDLAA